MVMIAVVIAISVFLMMRENGLAIIRILKTTDYLQSIRESVKSMKDITEEEDSNDVYRGKEGVML